MTGVDHIGVTVPDLDQAHEFFVGVLGCEYMYRLGPYRDDGSWMSEHMAVDDRTVMRRLRPCSANRPPAGAERGPAVGVLPVAVGDAV
ncbi:VOC family protein [Kutzneria sp. NPDC051319]|uniref:VOC family protein n=1 Tax=Kutzneria sp. NPDC051319 TaxID=3155047 RepID=UPI00341E5F76